MSDVLANTITQKDFNQICRTCLGFKNVSPISRALVENVKATYLLEYTIAVEVEEDDFMPPNICDDCLTNLYRVFEFKKQCQSNEFLLRSILDNECSDNSLHQLDVKDGDHSYCDWNESVDGSQTTEIDENEAIERESIPSPSFFSPEEETSQLPSHTNDNLFHCDLCSKAFKHKGNLQIHKMVHTGERPHICSFCGKGFIRAWCMRNHEKSHEKGAVNEDLECQYCGRPFRRRAAFDAHVLQHKIKEPLHQCEICSASFRSNLLLNKHLLIHGDKGFLCSFCGRSFKKPSGLDYHLKVHSDERPYKCMICEQSFKRNNNLRLHMSIHTGERPFKCRFCSKRFRLNAHVYDHERIHRGLKPYKCRFCGKGFISSWNMKAHAKTHTGVTPYVCEVCGIGFYNPTYLKKHRVKVHTVQPEPVESNDSGNNNQSIISEAEG